MPSPSPACCCFCRISRSSSAPASSPARAAAKGSWPAASAAAVASCRRCCTASLTSWYCFLQPGGGQAARALTPHQAQEGRKMWGQAAMLKGRSGCRHGCAAGRCSAISAPRLAPRSPLLHRHQLVLLPLAQGGGTPHLCKQRRARPGVRELGQVQAACEATRGSPCQQPGRRTLAVAQARRPAHQLPSPLARGMRTCHPEHGPAREGRILVRSRLVDVGIGEEVEGGAWPLDDGCGAGQGAAWAGSR